MKKRNRTCWFSILISLIMLSSTIVMEAQSKDTTIISNGTFQKGNMKQEWITGVYNLENAKAKIKQKQNEIHNKCYDEMELCFNSVSHLIFNIVTTDTTFLNEKDTIADVVFIYDRIFSYTNYNTFSFSYLMSSGKTYNYVIQVDGLLYSGSDFAIKKYTYSDKKEASRFLRVINEKDKIQSSNCGSNSELIGIIAFDFNDCSKYFRSFYIEDIQEKYNEINLRRYLIIKRD